MTTSEPEGDVRSLPYRQERVEADFPLINIVYGSSGQSGNAEGQEHEQVQLGQRISVVPARRSSENVAQDKEAAVETAVPLQSNSDEARFVPEGWSSLPEKDRKTLEGFFGKELPIANIYTLTQEELESLDHDPNLQYIDFLIPPRLEGSYATRSIGEAYSNKRPLHLLFLREMSRVIGRTVNPPAVIAKEGFINHIHLAHEFVHIRQQNEGYKISRVALDQDPLEHEAFLYEMGIFLRPNPYSTFHDFLRTSYDWSRAEWLDEELAELIQRNPFFKMEAELWKKLQEEVQLRNIVPGKLDQALMKKIVASIMRQDGLEPLKLTEEQIKYQNLAESEIVKVIALTMPISEDRAFNFEEKLDAIDFSKIPREILNDITVYHYGAEGVPDLSNESEECVRQIRLALVSHLKDNREKLLQIQNGRALRDLLPHVANVAEALLSSKEIQRLIRLIIEEKI